MRIIGEAERQAIEYVNARTAMDRLVRSLRKAGESLQAIRATDEDEKYFQEDDHVGERGWRQE